MNKEQYLKAIAEKKAEYEANIETIQKKFVIANRKFNTGDVVRDFCGSIKIEKTRFKKSLYSDFPEIVYYGRCVKVNGEPTKKIEYRWSYEKNIILFSEKYGK